MNYRDILNSGHILIAGTTGSGKSVLLNNLIIETLISENAQYIFIDPKRVELIDYKSMVNTLNYIDDNTQCESALNNVLDIINDRFSEMQEKSLKLYDGNTIYLIIDELADVFDSSSKCAKLLKRILQIARASKIQVIACTQSPSKKTIGGDIQVNFNVRIGLQLENIESKMIIGTYDCSTLPKYGYCIVKIGTQRTKLKVNMYDSDLLKNLVNTRTPKKEASNIRRTYVNKDGVTVHVVKRSKYDLVFTIIEIVFIIALVIKVIL